MKYSTQPEFCLLIALECPELAEGYLDPVNLATAKENMLEKLGVMAVLATDREVTRSKVMLSYNTLWMPFMTSDQVRFMYPFICDQFFNIVSMACY